jgi:putative nucleotidyltransferase with HDIG domain
VSPRAQVRCASVDIPSIRPTQVLDDVVRMLKRVPTARLRLGMYLHELDGSWMDHPFWRSRFALDNAEDLRRIAGSGIAWAWIDTDKGLDIDGGQSAQQVCDEVERELVQAAGEPARGASMRFAGGAVAGMRGDPDADDKSGDEMRRAAHLCALAKEHVQSLFDEARLGRAIDVGGCLPVVDEIARSVDRDRGALISVARLKLRDEYTYLHSVAVCALMVALARQLGLAEDQVRNAGLAGLLHDIGKARVPVTVLNKAGRLSDAEFQTMRTHPELGHALLRAGGVDVPAALDVCLHHHERVDGTGYPHRLAGSAISLLARMGAVCDVYDAVTSCRPYKDAWDPAEAIRKMAQWKGHFDTDVLHAFVKTVGIYPVGALVRLESGRLAVVTAAATASLLTPRVRLVYCTRTAPRLAPSEVDLAAPGCDDRISGVESAPRGGLEGLESLWLEMA